YNYWDFASVLSRGPGGATTCLRRKADGANDPPVFRMKPSGIQSVVVYTDEHGEAQVQYNPGVDAFYDALNPIKNANGGCDLEGIRVLGRSSITATARYPYKAVDDPAKVSAPLLKEVR